MSRIQKTSLLFCFAFITASIHAANAASFDCKKASGAIENVICSDAELSALDNVLAKAYADARSKFSIEGKNAIKAEQVIWLKNQMNCSTGKAINSQKLSACLKTEYKSRISELNRIGSFRNGVLIYTVHSKPGKNTYAYDQIDSQEPVYKKINLAAKKAITDMFTGEGDADDPFNNAMEVSIDPLTNNLYKVAFRLETNGGAHPSTDLRYSHFIKSESRQLTIADIFNAKQLKQLSQFLLTQQLSQFGEDESCRENNLSADDVVKLLTEMGLISIETKGLGVDMSSGFPYALRVCGYVDVSWDKLMPFLTDSFKAEVAKFK